MMVVVEAEGSAGRDNVAFALEAEADFVGPWWTLRRLVSDQLVLRFPHISLAAANEAVRAESQVEGSVTANRGAWWRAD